MSRYYITGIAGFIPSNLAISLIKDGHEVRGIDNYSHACGQSLPKPIVAKYGDIRYYQDIVEGVKWADIVLHLGAQNHVDRSIDYIEETLDVNIMGTYNVLEACRIYNKKLVFASSSEIYGTNMGKINENSPTIAQSPYATCYDENTEVLTDDGWKFFDGLKGSELLGTINKETQKLEFQKILKLYKYPYRGKMFYQKNRRLSLLVTPNHRLFVSHNKTGNTLTNPRLVLAEESLGKCYIHKIGANYDGGNDVRLFELPETEYSSKFSNISIKQTGEIDMNSWLKFLGWYLSEGNCYKTKGGNYNVVLTSFYRQEEAYNLFCEIGFSPRINQHHIFVSSKQLFDYCNKFGHARNKFIPKEFKQLKKEYLMVLLMTLISGDGNKNGRGWGYTSVSERLANDVQEISLKCGFSSSIRLDRYGFYRVSISQSTTAHCNLGENRSKWIDYDGLVYCASVDNETLLIRRNGKACFSGNSKLAGDKLCGNYHDLYGVKVWRLRNFNVYGPWQNNGSYGSVIPIFVKQALHLEPLTIFGSGEQRRDYMYIDDAIQAYKLITDIPQLEGDVVNAGFGKSISINDIGKLICKIMDVPFNPVYLPARAGEVMKLEADTTLFESYGFKPTVDIEKGLTQYIKWYKKYGYIQNNARTN